MTGAIYVVMASRDRSDEEVHSEDYPVCYFVDRRAADEYARLATERAHRVRIDLDLRRRSFPVGIAYEQGLRLAKDDMTSFDPRWEHGSEDGTTYSVATVSTGKLPMESPADPTASIPPHHCNERNCELPRGHRSAHRMGIRVRVRDPEQSASQPAIEMRWKNSKIADGEIADDQIRKMATWSMEHGAHAVVALQVPNGPVELAERNHSRAWLAAAWKDHGGSDGQ